MYSRHGSRGHGRCFSINKVSGVSLFVVLALGVVKTTIADEVQFQPAQLLSMDPGTHAIPCVTDWNGDGRKDLLVGYQTAGKIALYLNSSTGTDTNPVFSTFTNLKAGGSDIYLPSPGNCGAPAPFVCDYDNDGDWDLLVGDGAYGYVYFYKNTNTDAAPILAAGEKLRANGIELRVLNGRATPCVFDWNGDGLKDLLCGSYNGQVYYFKNTGTAQSPSYAAGTYVKAGGVDLNLDVRSVVRMFDWDGDGVKDLVGSSSTGVYWCRNVGTSTSPLLQARVALNAPVVAGGLVPIKTDASRMRLDLVDWNNDGVMDMLIGNSVGTVSCLIGYRFSMRLLGQDMCGGHILEWNSAPYLSYNLLAGESINGITNRVASGVRSSGVTTCWTNACGDTQQFFRLQIAP